MDNPFVFDVFSSKEITKQKMAEIFKCIERLYTLMEIESEFEPRDQFAGSGSKSADISPAGSPKKEQKANGEKLDQKGHYQMNSPRPKKIEHETSGKFDVSNLSKNLTKMKYF